MIWVLPSENDCKAYSVGQKLKPFQGRLSRLKLVPDFANIQAVFTNPIVERVDDRQDYGETRIILLGIINNRVLCIVYTLRGSICRIISARRANQREQKTYNQSVARRVGENEGSN